MGWSISRSAWEATSAFILSCGLLVSCNAARQPDVSPASLQVTENFSAAQLEQHFREISARVAPAVVAISATQGSAAPPHADVQDINGDRLASMLSSVDRTVGTGFVVDPDGYIVTNDHVIDQAEELWVTTDDHKVYPAVVVGADPWADLAVLKIPATHFAVAHLADGSRAQRGQWTIALGNPYGLSTRGQMCASVGIVSAVNQSLARLSDKEDRLYSGLIQTTAQINPGNSGGPLLDLSGDVIGINTAVILPQQQANGIGFAIPSTRRLENDIQNIKLGRQIVYAYLGAHVSAPTARERQDAGLADETAVRIDSIEDASPASGHLLAGDIVLRVGNQEVQNADQFARLIGDAPIGPQITAIVSRHGSTQSISLWLRARDASEPSIARENERIRWHGLLIAPVPHNWSTGPNGQARPGVMILAVDESTALHAKGLHPGAVISAINGSPVTTMSQVHRLIAGVPPEKCTLQFADADATSVRH
jgi:serine protease Do